MPESEIVAIVYIQCNDKDGTVATFCRDEAGVQVTPSFCDRLALERWLVDKGAARLPYSAAFPTGWYTIPRNLL